jgi:hypothetical protein
VAGERQAEGAAAKNLEVLRNFCGGLRVYVIDAERGPSDLSRHLHLFSDNEAAFFVASLIFLMARTFGVEPVPGDPSEVASLDDQDDGVGKEQMPVLHGAHRKERMPGHFEISKEASIA